LKTGRNIAKDERDSIFRLFLNDHRLRFSEIEKGISIRSNMVSYHLDRMIKDGLLEKKGFYYSLSRDAEKYIPVFSHIKGESLSAVPVVLVSIVRNNKILLMKRSKRPYSGYWGFIGGKVLLEESLGDAAVRLCKEKAGIDCKFVAVNTVLHERVVEDGFVKHGFFLFMVKVAVKNGGKPDSMLGRLEWFDIAKLDRKSVIPSDYWLIRNKLKSSLKIGSIDLYERAGTISGFGFK
jgi:8-oxo-dGTP pyrophosphatase MutT (NUDIX family)